MKITFVVMTEFLKHQQIYTMLKMVEAARARKQEVRGIFFFGTSVINLRKDVQLGKDTRNIPKALESLAKENIPMYACQTWADNFGTFPENAIEGAEIVGLGELSNMTYESDKLIVFGART